MVQGAAIGIIQVIVANHVSVVVGAGRPVRGSFRTGARYASLVVTVLAGVDRPVGAVPQLRYSHLHPFIVEVKLLGRAAGGHAAVLKLADGSPGGVLDGVVGTGG